VTLADTHSVEHLEVYLPALQRDHMPDIASPGVEDVDMRVVGEARPERVVGIEAVTAGGDRRRHELDAKGGRAWGVEVLHELPSPE
jgi:hypothetical protein